MQTNPFGGDLVKLKGEVATWRRRVGSYRIFFDVFPERLVVDVVEIARRTSTIYQPRAGFQGIRPHRPRVARNVKMSAFLT
jgi:hypothetical protein